MHSWKTALTSLSVKMERPCVDSAIQLPTSELLHSRFVGRVSDSVAILSSASECSELADMQRLLPLRCLHCVKLKCEQPFSTAFSLAECDNLFWGFCLKAY